MILKKIMLGIFLFYSVQSAANPTPFENLIVEGDLILEESDVVFRGKNVIKGNLQIGRLATDTKTGTVCNLTNYGDLVANNILTTGFFDSRQMAHALDKLTVGITDPNSPHIKYKSLHITGKPLVPYNWKPWIIAGGIVLGGAASGTLLYAVYKKLRS